MWVLKLRLRHDCIIGSRCQKYNCKSVGYPLDYYYEDSFTYFIHLETLYGDEKNVNSFIQDLKDDGNVKNIEVNRNTTFFTYKSKLSHMPSQSYLKKVFHITPVEVDETGTETWEVGGWERKDIREFIEKIKENTYKLDYFKILKIEKTKLQEIYFPKIMPLMTLNQKKALEIAIENNYYDYPRSVELKDLAKIMGISLSTYRQHLRLAEKRVLGK